MMRNKREVSSFKFKPFSKKQKQLMTWWMEPSPHVDKDIVIADGSIRAGKTVAMSNGFVDWSLANFEGENFILSGKSMGALTRNVLNPLKQMLTAKGIPYHHVRTTEEPRLEIGLNNYYLFGANNVSSKDVLTGLTAAGSLADQVELFPENFVKTLIDRCSIEGSRHWWNCNPEGPYHFLKKDYIDKADMKKILHMHFTLDDNLTLSEDIKKRYKRMHEGVWYQRNILGLWVLAEGLVYDMFDCDVHIVSKLPDMKQHWIGVDYGTANDTVFLLIGLGTDNKLYIIDEWRWGRKTKGKSKTDVQLRIELQKFINKHNVMPKWIFIDPSAASFITELFQHRKEFPAFKRVAKANNDVKDGIRRVSSLLGALNLFIHERCEGTIEEFQSYSWDEKAQERGKDEPIKEHDHGLDGLRYIINGILKIFEFVMNMKEAA
ncbi:PBSX family phage terminase large subunit [Halocella sp. SP3-1]|uniref:PBSX family phage terminase large subunit n=1 Tax=Halocella sp. SP3-1 TaxID=2382161 RepID=UPI00197AD93B|nr:PBSX family phage terminase large subunit [Halocella sp. SP3-1]